MTEATNEDHFELRKIYKSETGLTAFDKETVLIYVNWLEKRILKKSDAPTVKELFYCCIDEGRDCNREGWTQCEICKTVSTCLECGKPAGEFKIHCDDCEKVRKLK